MKNLGGVSIFQKCLNFNYFAIILQYYLYKKLAEVSRPMAGFCQLAPAKGLLYSYSYSFITVTVSDIVTVTVAVGFAKLSLSLTKLQLQMRLRLVFPATQPPVTVVSKEA